MANYIGVTQFQILTFWNQSELKIYGFVMILRLDLSGSYFKKDQGMKCFGNPSIFFYHPISWNYPIQLFALLRTTETSIEGGLEKMCLYILGKTLKSYLRWGLL